MTQATTADADLTVTARFVKQHQVSVGTSPEGRTVLVDNVSIAARTTFWWDDGVPHWLEAPPQPDDTPEARYAWQSWSDGMARAHSVVATAPLSLTATFVREATLQVTTSSEGLHFFVDDVEYSSSQTFWFELGSSHFVFAPPSQSAPGARYTFVNWSDGGSFGHPIQFSGAMSLEASFRAEFYLTLQAPAQVTQGGTTYDFAGWTGDAMSGQPTLTLTVHSPMTVHATYTATTGPLGVSTTGWGLLVVVIIAVALLVPILLRRRRKGRDEG